MSMRDKRSTLILATFIALQIIIAIALFAGAGGKKPEQAPEVVVEEVENSHKDAQESQAVKNEEPAIVAENPAEPVNVRYEEPTHVRPVEQVDTRPEEPTHVQLEEITPTNGTEEPAHRQP